MAARLMGMALCGALSMWPALARAEPPTPQTPAPQSPEPQNSELIAATPKGEAAPDFGAGDSQVEQARALFWSAHERYDAGEYASAAKLFEESYAEFPQAEVLFNIALARARSGRCRDAEHAFQEYSKAVTPSETTRAASENFQGTLSGCSEAPSQEPAPLQAPEPVDPALAPAPKPAPVVLTPPAAVVADAPPSDYWTTERVVGWSLLGAAAAATGVAFYFDNQRRDARAANEEILLDPDPDSDAGDESAQLEKEYAQAQIGIVAATATALGCAAVGAGLLIYGGDGAVSTTAHLAVGASGARIGLSGRF